MSINPPGGPTNSSFAANYQNPIEKRWQEIMFTDPSYQNTLQEARNFWGSDTFAWMVENGIDPTSTSRTFANVQEIKALQQKDQQRQQFESTIQQYFPDYWSVNQQAAATPQPSTLDTLQAQLRQAIANKDQGQALAIQKRIEEAKVAAVQGTQSQDPIQQMQRELAGLQQSLQQAVAAGNTSKALEIQHQINLLPTMYSTVPAGTSFTQTAGNQQPASPYATQQDQALAKRYADILSRMPPQMAMAVTGNYGNPLAIDNSGNISPDAITAWINQHPEAVSHFSASIGLPSTTLPAAQAMGAYASPSGAYGVTPPSSSPSPDFTSLIKQAAPTLFGTQSTPPTQQTPDLMQAAVDPLTQYINKLRLF